MKTFSNYILAVACMLSFSNCFSQTDSLKEKKNTDPNYHNGKGTDPNYNNGSYNSGSGTSPNVNDGSINIPLDNKPDSTNAKQVRNRKKSKKTCQ